MLDLPEVAVLIDGVHKWTVDQYIMMDTFEFSSVQSKGVRHLGQIMGRLVSVVRERLHRLCARCFFVDAVNTSSSEEECKMLRA